MKSVQLLLSSELQPHQYSFSKIKALLLNVIEGFVCVCVCGGGGSRLGQVSVSMAAP